MTPELRSTIVYWTAAHLQEPHVPAAVLVEGPEGVWIEPLPGAPRSEWWSARGLLDRDHRFVHCHSVPLRGPSSGFWWQRLEYFTEPNLSEAMTGRYFCGAVRMPDGRRIGGIKSHPGWTRSAEALALALVAELARYHPERTYAPE